MASTPDFVAHVLDLLAGLGSVQARAMFGGRGLYLQGRMFALIVDDRLYVKADAHSRAVFEAAALPPFSYEAKGRRVQVAYHEVPPEALDQPDAAVQWARQGLAAALRAPARRR
jgi:DNA transformation protein